MKKAVEKIVVVFEDGTQEEIKKGFAIAYSKENRCYSLKQFYSGMSKEEIKVFNRWNPAADTVKEEHQPNIEVPTHEGWE